jgi:putative hemolysin
MSTEHPNDSMASVKDDQSAMPDVSIKRCLDDGYEVVSVTKGGIPSKYLCIDPKTKRKCESWAYYRGSCQLVGSDKQPDPTTGITIKAK